MKRLILTNIVVLAAFLLPGISRAAFQLDTGTPTGSGGPLIVSSSQSLAGEFSAAAGETITQLAAYLSSSSGNGNSLAFADSSVGTVSDINAGIGLEVTGLVPEPATYGILAGLSLFVVSLGNQLRRKAA